MAKKRSKRERRPNRRAKRILERARLEARVIVAEARAETTDARTIALAEAHADAARIRAEAERSALQAVEHAHTEAGWILAQTRQFAQTEARALAAEAELGADRLQASATVAAEQLRREALAHREQSRRDTAGELARMRDEALLDAARLRDDARTEAAELLAHLDAEREAILDAARERTRATAALADEERADQEILAFLDAEAAAAAASRADPVPVEQIAALETVALFEPAAPTTSTTRSPLIWGMEPAGASGAPVVSEPWAASPTVGAYPDPAEWTLVAQPGDDSGFWAPSPPGPTRHRRWRKSDSSRS